MTRTTTWRRSCARFSAIAAVTAVLVVGAAAPASAHAQLVASTPSDGATVEEAVEHITLEFRSAVVALEDQFLLADAAGRPLAIASIDPGSGTTMHVVPAEPLDGGTYGLKWAARAGDTHPRTGTVTFTVEAVAPTPVSTAPSATGGDSTADDASGSSAHPAGHTTKDLREALTASDTGGPTTLAAAIRFVMYTGLLLAVGGLLYLAIVHRGTRAEGRRLVFLVRRAAVLIAVATLVELPVQAILISDGATDAILDTGAYGELLGGDFGVGILLRFVGAMLVLAGMRMHVDQLSERSPALRGDRSGMLEPEHAPSGAVATRVRAPVRAPQIDHSHRVKVTASPIALLGGIALVCSELFIGHAASTEPRWLVIAADATHVVAAGLWVAGVAMLALTLWRRHRLGAALEAALLATRFSVAAVAAVAAVSATGLALGITILDDVGSLFSTEFGRLLIVKVVLVTILVALGGYNQKIVIPSLERARTARRAGHRLRWLVTAEVVTFLAVLLVTAALVGADSTG